MTAGDHLFKETFRRLNILRSMKSILPKNGLLESQWARLGSMLKGHSKNGLNLVFAALICAAACLLEPQILAAEEPLVGTIPTMDPRAIGLAGTA